jgi:ABC-type lipoprotein export system ATPase subunit
VFAVYRSADADTPALQGAELAVGHGEIVCVQGPSGAGKTTLLRVIAGIQQPTVGSVLLLGQDIGRLSPRARALARHRQIGAIGQPSTALSPDLTIEQIVALPLALRGISRRNRTVRARALLELTGLLERRGAYPAELSGGERQRVALCAAIVHEPSLLLADEPTAELDAAASDELLAAISATAHAAGTSVLIASHDPAAGNHADRTLTLREGRIVEEHRDGHTTLTVSESGWLRLPDHLRDQAGIDQQVTATTAPSSVILTARATRDGNRAAPARPPSGSGGATQTPATGARPWLPAAVALRGLARRFAWPGGARVVFGDLSWEFEPGALTVVTGRSGSGKSTLLRLLAGLDRPDRGEVTLDGRPIHQLDLEALAALRRDRIGYLPQEPLLVGFLSAAENVQLALQIRNRVCATELANASDHLTRLGLSRRASYRAATLSAGEVQRVGLARALVAARGLVIADEPTSRLDRANAAIVAGWLAEAASRHNQTVICATHDPLLVARASSELQLQPDGQLLATTRRR